MRSEIRSTAATSLLVAPSTMRRAISRSRVESAASLSAAGLATAGLDVAGTCSAASRITTIGASEASVPVSVAKSPVTSSWCSALTARRQRPINSGSCAARRIDIERAGGRGCGSALAERHLPGLDDGLEQVVQERFLAGLDMHRGGHPRNDRQRLVPRRRDIAGGAYLHQIIAF